MTYFWQEIESVVRISSFENMVCKNISIWSLSKYLKYDRINSILLSHNSPVQFLLWSSCLWGQGDIHEHAVRSMQIYSLQFILSELNHCLCTYFFAHIVQVIQYGGHQLWMLLWHFFTGMKKTSWLFPFQSKSL